MSIGALINRLRTKALTSAAAHEIVQDLYLSRLQAYAKVNKLNGELVADAKMKDALALSLQHGMEVSGKLSVRLVETITMLKDFDWATYEAAETAAQQKVDEVRRRLEVGEIDRPRAERALAKIEATRTEIIEKGERIVTSLLTQIDGHVAMCLSTIQRDPDRYANYL